jgi:hypothetical protein
MINMPTKIYFPKNALAVVTMILIILACSLPSSKPPHVVPGKTSFTTPARRPIIKPAYTSIYTLTYTPLSSQQDMDDVLTFGGAATNTKTPLPPLPDFDEVITFVGGGGGPPCIGFNTPNAISTDVVFGKFSLSCMVILWMDFNKPFHLQMTAPNKKVYKSPNLLLNQNTKAVQWEGYHGFAGSAEWSGNGILHVSIDTWWPNSLSEGEWQVQAYGDNILATGSFMVVKQTGRPYITALDSRSETQIMPGTWGSGLHPVRLKNNGRIDVTGSDFPANTEIYVLLYRYIPSNPAKAKLSQKLSVISNSAGSIKTELSAPFELGQSYLVIGLSDPDTPLSGSIINSDPLIPSDYFLIETGSASVTSEQTFSSCPGAPTQRMVVNQRGYVCTQTDSVRLRNAPQKSSSTIAQLPKGTKFTVIGGSSCADNWSWWQVKTDNGLTGWISEGGDSVDPYFICPIP